MKVLWITNILFPEAEKILTGKANLTSSGGWMLGAAEALLQYSDIQLTIATSSRRVDRLTQLDGKRINYYVLPANKNQFTNLWRIVKDEVGPDIVHIHGTEYPHSCAYVKANGADRVVISMQGLTSVIPRYYLASMSYWNVIRNITPRDLIRGTLFSGKRSFRKRGNEEVWLLQNVNHIIGRTSWDRAHVWAINPNARYYYCNEILRHEFYSGQWEYDRCVPHTIFISQAGYPLKGLHQIIKALPLILRHYPNTQVRVAGNKLIDNSSLYCRLKRSGYGHFIEKLISRLHLNGHVIFLGPLNAAQMKEEYLMANVFVCPSSIENSSNSLGEAQILGIPCICSYVGGSSDMMCGNENGLYRFEETEMLAWKICQVFDAVNKTFLRRMADQAAVRHDRQKNTMRLISVYREICK